MKYLIGTSLAVLLSACATVEPLCNPDQRRAVTNAAGDVLYYVNPPCPPVRDGRDAVFASMPAALAPVVTTPEPTPPAPSPEPSAPTTPNTPDRPKGDASLNSGEGRTGRGDNGKGQGKSRP